MSKAAILAGAAMLAAAVASSGCCCRSGGGIQTGQSGRSVSEVPMQNKLHEGLRPFPEAYRNASNEIKKSEIFRNANEWRAAFAKQNGLGIVSWQGVITDISTTQGGGLAAVSVKSEFLGFRIFFRSGMRIEKGSGLYAMIEPLREGAAVVFSGKFVPDDVKGYKEISLTERGSLDEPEFLVDFTEIKPASAAAAGK